MANLLKVYGGVTMWGTTQVRTILATTSWEKAAKAIGEPVPRIRGGWSVTSNPMELETALDRPGVVFRASTLMEKDFSA